MRTILGYDIRKWAVFFHMYTQSVYVLESAKDENGRATFITPLAEEIHSVLGKVINEGEKIPGLPSKSEIYKIVKYGVKEVFVLTKNREINPSLLLLATMEALYNDEFPPMNKFFGTGVVKEFIYDFSNRVSTLGEESVRIYDSCVKLANFAITGNPLSYSVKKTINSYKEQLKDVLDKSYGDDPAHDMKHIDDVLLKALTFNYKYNVQCNESEIIVAVLLHDMFSSRHRKAHNELACDWIRNTKIPLKVFEEAGARERIARAVLEHRASYGDTYFSPLSELLASADRGEPNIENIILRSFAYTQNKNPDMSHQELIDEVVKHLEEKFSIRGYSKYTNIYAIEYGHLLESLHKTIDSIVAGSLKIKIAKFKDTYKVSLKK